MRDLQRIGKYQLLQLLSEGRYTDVWLAERIDIKKKVAIKILFPEEIGNERLRAQKRFFRNAQTLGQLEHPQIVRFIDYGIEDGIPYLVRDFIPNGSLRDLLPKGNQLPLDTVLNYVKQIAKGLDYIHSKGVVHQNVKPENMLLGDNGEIFLSDFGIACLVCTPEITPIDNIDCKNTSNLVILDACYSEYTAPEQFEGYANRRSDQYSLACVAYELLTGELPFRDTLHLDNALDNTQKKEHPRDDEHHLDVPQPVKQVLLKALAKNPTSRYESVAAFMKALVGQRMEDSGSIKKYRTKENEGHLASKYEGSSFHHVHQNVLLQENDTFPILSICLAKPYIENAFAYLPWLERNCLLLYADAEFAQEDIAEILGLNKKVVHKYLVRASRLWLHAYNSLLEKDLGISLNSISDSHHEDFSRVKRLIQNKSLLTPQTIDLGNYREAKLLIDLYLRKVVEDDYSGD